MERLVRFLDERPLGINNRYFASWFPDTCWVHYLDTLLLELPTNIYLKCRFKDYCTFFRDYKAKFQVSSRSDVVKQAE